MRQSGVWRSYFISAIGLLAAGCNDLGTCDDPAKGRTTVEFGRGVVYTGQAILLTSCAAGCHSSGAKGENRKGAPAGLDFDLSPITNPVPGPAVASTDGGVIGVQVDAQQIAGLRARQRKVFDEREAIWEQIDKGLMPPLPNFKNLMNIFRTKFAADASCTRGESLGDLDKAKADLRNWLACGTPIVEAFSNLLPYGQPAGMDPADTAAGAAAYAGSTGYQYPECKSDVGPGGPTFEQIYDSIFASAVYTCTPACHGTGVAMGNFDIGTVDKAYTTLLGANGQGGMTSCPDNARPYVKPGDPAGSFLIAKLGGNEAGAICPQTTLMPPQLPTGISAADLDLIRQWIMAGAAR